MENPHYSDFFSCLYDEPSAMTRFGQGAHYSIFRAVEWLDVWRKPLKLPEVHDFAVIWDKDHDARIIRVLERFYMAGLLSPVQFVGEHEGTITVIVDVEFWHHANESEFKDYTADLQEICRRVDHDEYWSVNTGMFDRSTCWPPDETKVDGLIEADEYRAVTYLRNIENLWQVGVKSYVPAPMAPKPLSRYR